MRRLHAESIERRKRQREEADAFLGSQLEPGEEVLARSGEQPIVTDRRILSARQLYQPPRNGEWVCDSLAFSQIRSWATGHQHDDRPLIRLEHDPIQRIEHVVAHNVLWFHWGDAEGPVSYTTLMLAFARPTNPVLVALSAALEKAGVPRRPSFIIRPESTREERTRTTPLVFNRASSARSFRFRLHRLSTRLYRGQVAWRVRLPSWLILAIPAWFIEPWLVVPAILLAEVAWIVFMQSRWRREQNRQLGLN
jgi:hypothetical protein